MYALLTGSLFAKAMRANPEKERKMFYIVFSSFSCRNLSLKEPLAHNYSVMCGDATVKSLFMQ